MSELTFEDVRKKISKFNRNELLWLLACMSLDCQSNPSKIYESKAVGQDGKPIPSWVRQGYILQLAHFSILVSSGSERPCEAQVEELIVYLHNNLPMQLIKERKSYEKYVQYKKIIDEIFCIDSKNEMIRDFIKELVMSMIKRFQLGHLSQYGLNPFLTHFSIFDRLTGNDKIGVKIINECKEKYGISHNEIAARVINFWNNQDVHHPAVFDMCLMPEKEKTKAMTMLNNTHDASCLYLPNCLLRYPIVDISELNQPECHIFFNAAFIKKFELLFYELKDDAVKQHKTLNLGEEIIEKYLRKLFSFYLKKDKNVKIKELEAKNNKQLKCADFILSNHDSAIIVESKASAGSIEDKKLLEPENLKKLFSILNGALKQCECTLSDSSLQGKSKKIAIICVNQELFCEGGLFRYALRKFSQPENFDAVEVLSIFELEGCLAEFSFDEIVRYSLLRWNDEIPGDNLLFYMRSKMPEIEKKCWHYHKKTIEKILDRDISDSEYEEFFR